MIGAKFCSSCSDKCSEAVIGYVADTEAQQEPVPERFEFIALRHLVARAEERNQRDLHLLVAVVEDTLISDLQQRIQDRAACLEDLVKEDKFSLDQLTRRDAPVLVALESADRHRPEQLLRRGEAR